MAVDKTSYGGRRMISLIFSYYEIALRVVVGQKIRPTTAELSEPLIILIK